MAGRSSRSTRSSATTSSRRPVTSPSSAVPTRICPSAPLARLAAAGRRAKDRLDGRAATALLTRAAELLRPHRLDLALELEAAWASYDLDGHVALQTLDTVAERASASGDHSGALLARATGLSTRVMSGELGSFDEQEALCRAALPFEEERGDPRRLALLWWVIGITAQNRMHNDDAVVALERALGHFRRAGDSPSVVAMEIDWALILGPRPADEGPLMLEELAADRPPGDGDLARAVLLAMLGRIDDAWPLGEARSEHLREVTGGIWADAHLAVIAIVEGDRERACRHQKALIDALPPGNDGLAASYRLPLARDLCYLGRLEAAERELRLAQAVEFGPVGRALGPAVEALILGARGELEQAEALAREGLAVAEDEMDNALLQGWGHEDLATVLAHASRIDEARTELERAVAIFERKRCLPYAERLVRQIDLEFEPK